MSTARRLDDSTHHIDRFIEVSNRFVRMAFVDDFSLIPYKDPGLPYFSKLPPPVQNQIIDQMELMISVGEKLHDEKTSLRGPSMYAWSFCNAVGLVPPSDLYARIPTNTIIDVYDNNHKLIFASLEFFEIVSYSLEELYSRPWMELFLRDNSATHDALFQISKNMLAGMYKGPIDVSGLGSHVLRESAHPDLRWVRTQPRLFSPLFKHGKPAGYLCTNEIVEMSLNCLAAKKQIQKN